MWLATSGEIYFVPIKLAFNTKCEKRSSNKPGTAKVGAISKGQNCKKDPLSFVRLQLVAKYEKNLKGDPWEILKNFRKKIKNEIFEQCRKM